MRPLTASERRTLRLAGIGISVYLVLFFGVKGWRGAEKRRLEYRKLAAEAATWSSRLAVYDDKVDAIRKLMELYRMDPAKLSRTSLVAEASSALQTAAMQGGVQIASMRESLSRSATGRELSGIQLEAMGQPPGVLRFLQSLETLGYPLVADTVQLTPAPMGPGMLKLNLTLLLLDFEKWKNAEGKEGKPDA